MADISKITVNGIEYDLKDANRQNLVDGETEGSIRTVDANPIIGEGGIALGEGATAGCMGYYIKSIDVVNKKIYLSTTPETTSIEMTDYTDVNFITPLYEVGDWFYLKNGSQHVVGVASITSIIHNCIECDNDLKISEIKPGSHFFCVPSKPTIGVASIFTNMIAFGSAIAAGEQSFAAGEGGVAINYGTVFGKNGIAGNSAFVAGINNKGLGTTSAVFGEGNTAYDWGTLIGGQGSTVHGVNNLVGGGLHKVNGNSNLVGGQGNNLEGNYNGMPGGANNHFRGDNSVIFGYSNNGIKSNGDKTLRATIIGTNNYGQFNDIVVIGDHLVAGANGQTVLGKWNNPNGKPLIIGCGEQGARKNALEVDKDGNAKFSGTVTDGNGNVLGDSSGGDSPFYVAETTVNMIDGVGWGDFFIGDVAFKDVDLSFKPIYSVQTDITDATVSYAGSTCGDEETPGQWYTSIEVKSENVKNGTIKVKALIWKKA
jgi:hypothetical protein